MKVIRASHGKLDRLASEEGKENISGSVDAPSKVLISNQYNVLMCNISPGICI